MTEALSPVIEIQNATVYRGRTRVFDGFSLRINRGENTVILGPNGSGKSTFLRLLSRDIYPVHHAETSIHLFGNERWHVSALRKQMGIVSHDLQYGYTPTVACIEVVLSGLYASIGTWSHQQYETSDRKRATALLESLDIPHLADRPFGTLSTGEQRRVLLARALIHDPSTLILDEPTSGLDIKASYTYLETIRGLIRRNKTIILVTHHIHEIPPEIDRVVLLDKGHIYKDGPKNQILTSEHMSQLYGTPLSVIEGSGYYQVLPASLND